MPCVRLNPLVPAAPLLRPELERLGEPVPWCGDAFVMADAQQRLGHCLEFRLGALYIQAKATTLAVEALAPQPGELVLDLAAAPGGKTTQIAGRIADGDETSVVDGSLEDRRFVMLFHRGGKLRGVLGMNRPRLVMKHRAQLRQVKLGDGPFC